MARLDQEPVIGRQTISSLALLEGRGVKEAATGSLLRRLEAMVEKRAPGCHGCAHGRFEVSEECSAATFDLVIEGRLSCAAPGGSCPTRVEAKTEDLWTFGSPTPEKITIRERHITLYEENLKRREPVLDMPLPSGVIEPKEAPERTVSISTPHHKGDLPGKIAGRSLAFMIFDELAEPRAGRSTPAAKRRRDEPHTEVAEMW